MDYYISRIVQGNFDDVIKRVKETLKIEGFGILTEIDVADTLKKKIDEDFRPYTILGACNPKLAHQVLLKDDKIGVLLPCNVIVQSIADGVEVAAVNPIASIGSVDNPEMTDIAKDVKVMLDRAIAKL